MKNDNFLTARASWLRCFKETAIQGEYTFGEFFSLPDVCPPYMYMTRIRDAQTHAKRRHENKADADAYNAVKSSLPCLCVSGTFQGSRQIQNITSHTGFICIDIDEGDNPHVSNWEEVKHMLGEYDCIAYCSLSLSGAGLFCIIPIDKPRAVVIPPIGAEGRADAIREVKELHEGQFRALQKTFQMLGLNIDKQCKDLTRVRVLSYDPSPYMNIDAEIYPHIIREEPKAKKPIPAPTFRTSGSGESLPEWLTRHGVQFVAYGERYMIECPWEHLHTAHTGIRQTCVWEDQDGQWCFHCFHSHCADRGWKDFRNEVAPNKTNFSNYRTYRNFDRL